MTQDEDRRIRCVDCGEDFLFTVGEQTFYREKGLTNAPTRCKTCRSARKTRGAEAGGGVTTATGRALFPAVCSECGVETQVPFEPTGSKPVFCRNCFQKHKPARDSRPPKGQGKSRGPRAASGAPASEPGGARLRGAVKWFNEGKGFGFIQLDKGDEVFVHLSAVRLAGAKSLRQGDQVEFDVVPGARGNQAANVVRIG